MRLKAIWDKYGVGIIVTVIGGVIVSIVTVSHFWESVKNIFSDVYSYLTGNIYVPRYYIGILLILALGGIALVCARLFNSRKIEKWENVKEVRTRGVKWRWTNIGMEIVTNIRPFCGECGFELIYQQSYVKDTYEEATNMYCQRCGKTIEAFPVKKDFVLVTVEKIIQNEHRKSMGLD